MLSPCDNVIQLLVHMLMLTGLTLKFSNIEYTALHSQQKHTLTHTQPFYGHCKVNLCHRQLRIDDFVAAEFYCCIPLLMAASSFGSGRR